MGVALFNYGTSNDNLTVSSAAQEMAAAIKEAQAFGLSVRESAANSGQFSYSYGVYFNPTSNPSDYYIFVDKDNDKYYDVGNGCGSASTECIEKVSIRNNVHVTAVCDSTACPPSASVKGLNITFLRPNPDGRIYFSDSSGNIIVGPSSKGKVTLTSAKNKSLNVIVESNGQVLIQ